MYLTRRRYRLDRSKVDDVVRGAQGLVPVIGAARGFVAYYVVKTEDGVSSLSVFETKAQAEESTNLATSYIKEEIGRAHV